MHTAGTDMMERLYQKYSCGIALLYHYVISFSVYVDMVVHYVIDWHNNRIELKWLAVLYFLFRLFHSRLTIE